MTGTATCLSALFATVQIGLASRFGDPGDPWAGGTPSCRYHMVERDFRTAVQQGCAHRWLPCGTRLLVMNLGNGRSGTCTVVERGPYGALHRGRWVLKRRHRDPGTWRGVLDLLPAAAIRLGVTGLHPVVIVVARPAPPVPTPAASCARSQERCQVPRS